VQMEFHRSKKKAGRNKVFKMMLKVRVISMFTDVILTFSTRYRDAFIFSRAFHFLGLEQMSKSKINSKWTEP
jgi:hypothetical protein